MVRKAAPAAAPARTSRAGAAPARQPAQVSRREEILDAAAEVFAERGVADATVRHIADRVGILSGSLYHHFTSKESMVEEILRRYLSDILDEYGRAAAEETGAAEALASLISRALRGLAARRAEVRILHNDWQYLEALGSVREANGEVERIWTGVIARGIADGTFRRDMDPRLVYRTVMGSILSVVRWYRPDGEIGIDEVARVQTEIFLAGLRA